MQRAGRRGWVCAALLALLGSAGAASLQLRWSAPEPQLIGGKVVRPTVHRSAAVPLDPARVRAAVAAQSPAGLGPELERAYAAVEARRARDIRFVRAGRGWVGQAVTGWRVDRAATGRAVLAALGAGQAAAPLTLRLVPPPRSVRWAAEVGLRHLGAGASTFTGSPPFRVHNIRVGAARLGGVWLSPGAEFDFNALVGPATAARGFQRGYVVTGDTLSLEDGGGLCQVSTTAFRAALQTGRPISERHAHSYQVGYYGAGGTDAAVYAPAKNLRWINDTRGPLLVQAEVDVRAARLTIHLFGVPDGRRVEVGTPWVAGVRPPPDPTFVADRALKPGEARRLDMPAPGARMNVVRVVTWPGGRERRDEFNSVYRAWGGVFAVAPGDERLR